MNCCVTVDLADFVADFLQLNIFLKRYTIPEKSQKQVTLSWMVKLTTLKELDAWITLPETNIAPENRSSQKENHLTKSYNHPFSRGYVSFRGCI